jgi:hypothetical protein
MNPTRLLGTGLTLALLGGCFSPAPEGLAEAPVAKTTVKMDFEHRPLPEIPLPNDIATRYDATAPTKRRVNASLIAPTNLERGIRERIDQLDGWGVNQPITVPFTGPLGIQSILDGHRDPTYDFENDVIYLINVTPGSPGYGDLQALDVGEGNYPTALERLEYWDHDPRNWLISIFFDEADEDVNRNGRLDDGEDANGNGTLDDGEDTNGNGQLDGPEDTDADGILDVPNYLPGAQPARSDLGARSDALMTFYERETNTLIVRPLDPLRERTTYAVVITRRLLDADGAPVGSPFEGIAHTSQADALEPISGFLPSGTSLSDVAFAWTFTTQSIQSDWIAVREGLYGHGVQAHLAREFPAVLDGVEPLLDDDSGNPYILSAEKFLQVYRPIATQLQNQRPDSIEFQDLVTSHQYVDYHVIGRFKSPQLFDRTTPDADAPSCEIICPKVARCGGTVAECMTACAAYPPNQRACLNLGGTCPAQATCDADSQTWMGLNDQAWPVDLSTTPAKARSEDVRFWLTVPRKEISARRDNSLPPIVIVGHGYGSNRFEMAQFGGFFARHGMAAIAIDCVSHGLGVSESERTMAMNLLRPFGLLAFGEAAFKDRGHDQNRDGSLDSAADFWTAYIFHTRDVVRQCGLDYTQLIRIIESFDGERRWDFDLDGDGENELAGDFDADGHVDIGHGSTWGMTGGSLGGIMALFMGGVEPHISSIVPISGGAGLGDIGNRSQQSGVREAVLLRVMGPLITGEMTPDGQWLVKQIVPDLNDTSTSTIALLDGVNPGDTLIVDNLDNGNRGCSYITAGGTARANIESDLGDHLELSIYAGPQLIPGDEDCGIKAGVEPKLTLGTFDQEVQFQELTYNVGDPLVALAEGYGEGRSTPGMRRFLGLAQLVLDPGDPGTYARHMLREPLKFPNMGDETGTHALIVTTMGDMNVPASSGLTVGRAAGLISWTDPLPVHGVPANQLLLDTYVAEAVHTYGRYHDVNGNPVHLDVDNFSDGQDLWRDIQVPRLDPPLRLGFGTTDALGGKSAAVFPYNVPTGQHGFAFPGGDMENFAKACLNTCPEGEDCDCDNAGAGRYDVGRFMFNLAGHYMATGGMALEMDQCHSNQTCDYEQPVPPER